MSIEDRALAAIDERRAIATLRALIDTPSPTGSERDCALELGRILRSGGLRARIQPVAPGRANVVATVGRDADGLRIHLTGHLDTTGYGDDRDRSWLRPGTPSDLPQSRLVDDVVSGLGAYNMKAGIAAAAEAVLALSAVARDLRGSVTLAAVAGESEKAPVDGLYRAFAGPAYFGGGIGTEWLLDHGPVPDAAVVCEPSGLAVVNAQPGYLLLRVSVLGRAGYLPDPERPTVVTAVATMAERLRGWAVAYRVRAAVDCGLGIMRPTCTVGAIESGAPFKPGGTPEVGRLYVDLRVVPGASVAPLVAELEGLVRTVAGETGPFTAGIEVFADNTPGAIIPADHPLVEAARDAVDEVTGRGRDPVPDFDFTPGDDGKVFARRGIPYVKVGPATPATRDPRFGREQVRVPELLDAVRAYVRLGVDLANRSRDEVDSWPAPLTGPIAGEGR